MPESNDDERLKRLHQIAGLIRDRDLGRFQAALGRARQIEEQLERAKVQPVDLPEWENDLRRAVAYNRWVDQQRARLTTDLAREKARAAELQAAAARALGRAEVLAAMLQKAARPRG